MKLWMAYATVALSVGLILTLALAGCQNGTPTSSTKVYVTGDGNATTVGTSGGAAGTAPCAGNVGATGARNPAGSASQGTTVTPNCAGQGATTLPTTPEAL